MRTLMSTLLLCFSPSLVLAATITSKFDSSNEGWTTITNGGSVPSHVASGGNPGGYLSETDASNGAYTLVAPSKFLGDRSSYTGGTLSLDAIVINTDGFPILAQGGTVTLRNGALSATLDLAPGGLTLSWESYSMPLTAAAWGVSDSDWATILGNITDIEIIMDSTTGDDTTGIDNFTMAEPKSAHPVPMGSARTLILIAGGLLAVGSWSRRVHGRGLPGSVIT